MKVLVTCPPMLGMIDAFQSIFDSHGIELTAPQVVQTLSVSQLKELVPQHDGWIIGDDPATREVFTAGKAGRLKAAVKWGIGVDNVDFSACRDLGIPITNTPNMFGGEVADVAVGYVWALAKAEGSFTPRQDGGTCGNGRYRQQHRPTSSRSRYAGSGVRPCCITCAGSLSRAAGALACPP